MAFKKAAAKPAAKSTAASKAAPKTLTAKDHVVADGQIVGEKDIKVIQPNTRAEAIGATGGTSPEDLLVKGEKGTADEGSLIGRGEYNPAIEGEKPAIIPSAAYAATLPVTDKDYRVADTVVDPGLLPE